MSDDEDDKTIFLNSNDANKLHRICTRNGCTPDMADAIAIEWGAAEARSFTGQLEATLKNKFLHWSGGAFVAVLLGLGAWFMDFIKVGG